jgi:hypothetical protein
MAAKPQEKVGIRAVKMLVQKCHAWGPAQQEIIAGQNFA